MGLRDLGTLEGSACALDSESMDDVLLLFSEAHWTFLPGLSVSGLGGGQGVGLGDSMEGSVRARSRQEQRGQRTEGEASREKGGGRARAPWEG
jgi:hypothetical protein